MVFGASEKNRGTVLTSLQVVFSGHDKNFMPFNYHSLSNSAFDKNMRDPFSIDFVSLQTSPFKTVILYNPVTGTFFIVFIGQFQKISIPNHRQLPSFHPPLPLEIPKCVTPPCPQNSIIVNPPLPYRISVVFGKYIFDLATPI